MLYLQRLPSSYTAAVPNAAAPPARRAARRPRRRDGAQRPLARRPAALPAPLPRPRSRSRRSSWCSPRSARWSSRSRCKSLIDQGFVAADPGARVMALREHFLALFGVGVALGVFSAARFYTVSWLGERVTADLRNAVYAHVRAPEPGVLRDHADRRGAVAPDHRHDAGADGRRLEPVDGPAQRGDGRRRDGDADRHQPVRDDAGARHPGAGGAAVALLRPARAQPVARQPGPRRRLERDRRRGAERHPGGAELPAGRARGRRASRASTEHAFGTAVRRTRMRSLLVAFIISATFGALLWGLYQGTQAVLRGDISAGHLGQTVVYVIILVEQRRGAVRGLRRPAARRRRDRAADGAAAAALADRLAGRAAAAARRRPRGASVRFERRHLPLSVAAAASDAGALQPRGRARRDGGAGRPERRRQEHGVPAAAALLRRRSRARSRSTACASTASRSTRCATRIGIVPQDSVDLLDRRDGEHPLRPARRERRRGRSPRRAAAFAHDFISALPEGYEHLPRRARRAPVGRPAPAHRDRARDAEEPAAAAARRGDQRARRRKRAHGAGGARVGDARPHDARHRAPPGRPCSRPTASSCWRPARSSRPARTPSWSPPAASTRGWRRCSSIAERAARASARRRRETADNRAMQHRRLRLARRRRAPGPLAVRRLPAPRARPRRRQGRPHRHRHEERVRPPDALRPARRLPARHDEEGAPALDHPRAALVPARRRQRALAAGARRHDLGRVGAPRRRPRPGLRRAVALVADARRRPHRPDRQRRRAAQDQPRLAPHHRQRLERRRRCRRWRCCRAMRSSSSTSRPPPATGARPAQLPALPAQRRHLPRRAVQHRELRAAHAHAGAAVRPRRRRLHLDRRRLPHLQQPRRAGRAAARRARPSRIRCSSSRAGRRRSSTTATRTSSSTTTATTRRSRRRSRSSAASRAAPPRADRGAVHSKCAPALRPRRGRRRYSGGDEQQFPGADVVRARTRLGHRAQRRLGDRRRRRRLRADHPPLRPRRRGAARGRAGPLRPDPVDGQDGALARLDRQRALRDRGDAVGVQERVRAAPVVHRPGAVPLRAATTPKARSAPSAGASAASTARRSASPASGTAGSTRTAARSSASRC